MAAKPDAFWTMARVERVKKILARHSSLADAAAAVSKSLKARVSPAALDNAFYQRGLSARSLLQQREDTGVVWTESRLDELVGVLHQHVSLTAAVDAASRHFGRKLTRSLVDNALKKRDTTAYRCLRKLTPALGPAPVDQIPRLVELVRKPIAFAELCDKLDMPPGKVKALVERARAEGVKVHVEHNEVALHFPEPIDKVQKTGVAPVIGKRQILGVISDTHLGSKYCLREQLKDCVHYLYERGVRHIVHPGDMLDGCYEHGKFELTHVGVEDQTRDFFEVLPKLPGLQYHCIGGNHDQTFTDASGVDTPKFIVNYFNKRGRFDITEYGMRSAYLEINGVVINMWHPKGGGAYAKSYNTQKKCEGYGAIKPQILLTGHYHFFDYHEDRAIQAIACPTFQGGQSAYGKTMKSAPAIGGLLLGWDLTRDGTMRDFALEKRGYFEVERPVNVMKKLDGQPVEVVDAVTESTARTVRQGRRS